MKLIVVGLTGLTLAFGAATLASAQDAKPAAAAAGVSVDTKIGELLADPATKAVLDKDIPALETSPYLDMAKGMSVREISKYPQANIDDAKLATIDADLKAAKPAS